MSQPPPEPLLLDTCVLQHLAWVERIIEESGGSVSWSVADEARLASRYGTEMARQLLDLGMLYVELQERDGFPWLVSTSAQAELDVHVGRRAAGNLDLWRYFTGHQGDWDAGAFPGVALGALRAGGTVWRPSPLILRALGVDDVTAIIASDGPLSFLPDTGDRCIARDALLANVPGILTLDLRTFWRYREELAHLGVEVLRPSDLLDAYEQVWIRD